MLTLLSLGLQIVKIVMDWANRQSIETAGAAKATLAAWERNNGFVTQALAAGEAKRAELDADPSKLHERDKNFKDD